MRVAADDHSSFEEERDGAAVGGGEIRGKATGRNAGKAQIPGNGTRTVRTIAAADSEQIGQSACYRGVDLRQARTGIIRVGVAAGIFGLADSAIVAIRANRLVKLDGKQASRSIVGADR
ncbi:hypothetical protein X744_02720 [Mesorhizobium sp. LNJC372A00]|uniref:hypothetical protein n=1 Tax=Mesorhizobium sp. LNJC372A00 TaxID=1287256 RepID=UPI0003CF36BD|nr:hypothetical protein [Mesorhizobium sp. LNJC372A00]ESY62141.1 hypothetical protein X744_02720 [Mesorhizobium sp. LNJC372A00]ESZ60761.1 hypothetical protein X729_14350 [Mesorhizobium sp. L103C131B0]